MLLARMTNVSGCETTRGGCPKCGTFAADEIELFLVSSSDIAVLPLTMVSPGEKGHLRFQCRNIIALSATTTAANDTDDDVGNKALVDIL